MTDEREIKTPSDYSAVTWHEPDYTPKFEVTITKANGEVVTTHCASEHELRSCHRVMRMRHQGATITHRDLRK